ncbi:efflux RND transporter periplasmic adaptor subunit [Roseisalinus antarcticus]|uniref:Multidrug resistance protein MdtE n=1 Tax=Roseisalinus antarcticus TaxID=254357 RepID=A0A1Y5SH12_9RHOB|nr:efflux RND transporter periplasmic adaptor subunit [Roseisalinus antarcticus]SLN40650.1 Multidrug resistance protein MdtE precursor [Roseisalinus antarcticus]
MPVHLAAQQVLDPVLCLVEPSETAELSFPVEGLVSAVHVSRGDVVTKGDLLAELDTTIEAIKVERARARAANPHQVAARQARLDYLEGQAERAERLAENRAIPAAQALEARLEADVAREELASARMDRELAEIEAREADLRLEQKRMIAPMSGVVTERSLTVGEMHEAQTHVLTLARVDRLRVEAFPPISYYGAVAVGDTLTVRPEDPIGGNYAAVVTVVDQVFDAATGTFGLRLELDNSDLVLPAGLRCDLIFAPPS